MHFKNSMYPGFFMQPSVFVIKFGIGGIRMLESKINFWMQLCGLIKFFHEIMFHVDLECGLNTV
jgi:hypothetical protein